MFFASFFADKATEFRKNVKSAHIIEIKPLSSAMKKTKELSRYAELLGLPRLWLRLG
jgi:hypothetical protein